MIYRLEKLLRTMTRVMQNLLYVGYNDFRILILLLVMAALISTYLLSINFILGLLTMGLFWTLYFSAGSIAPTKRK